MPEADTRRRAHYLAPLAYYELNRAADVINHALGGFGCYLVGSCLTRRDYRDVDVRFILEDEDFDQRFSSDDAGDALWSLLCTSISAWLAKQTGLPVDFQIQRRSDANARYDGIRNALGIVQHYPGELPSILMERRRDRQR